MDLFGNQRRSALARTFLLVPLVVFATVSTGFIPTRSSNGARVTWGHGARLAIRSNETNQSGLSGNLIFDIFTRSLNRWKTAAFGGFDFVYYQGSNPSVYPNFSGSTGDSNIFFTSNGRSAAENLGCGTVAVTQVWFNTVTGQAMKADLRFNDNCFQFTNNPSDTASQRNIYLPDVATHELGHALGLDHSQNLQSSMVYTAAIQQSLPSCDDQAAMLSLYAPGSHGAQTGTVGGTVISPAGDPIFGAFAEAVSLERGVSLASAITDRDGSFSISGLEPGTYTIIVSPFAPGAASLSRYYEGISSNVCGGAPFARTVMHDGQTARTVNVDAGGTYNFGGITVACSAMGSRFSGAERVFGAAPVVAPAGLDQSISFTGSFSQGSDHYYRVNGVTGKIVAHALTYSLFARNDVVVELYDTSGRRLVGQRALGDVFAAPSGYVNYDSETGIDVGATPTDLVVRVSSRGPVNSAAFPSGSVGLDSNPFYLLTLSNGGNPSTELYPANARCERSDAFSAYARQGDPAPQGPGGSASKDGGSGGCGMIFDPDSNNGSGNMHDPFNNAGATARMLNFAGLLALLTYARRRLRTA